ncbi:hypothetical protein ACFU6S_36140 [Streptomyces sp. NPDC057456]|uniref:hypothetical protein n=1 Tax=Streptomyces sp. NPDC057456 TaxID=3346139 RepID=UPI00368F52C3
MNDTDEHPVDSRRRRFDAVHKWAATAAAVVALAFSAYNFAEIQQKPKIDVTLPHLLRIGPVEKGTIFFIQPTVSTRLKTQDVEVIRDAQLQLTPVGPISSMKRPVFYWSDTGAWKYDFPSDSINYEWTGDPAPFIVAQDKPQQPTFSSRDDNWGFQSGRYDGSLRLGRSGNRDPLVRRFCLIMSKEAAGEIRGADQRKIFFFRNDLPKFHSSSSSPGCYRRETD